MSKSEFDWAHRRSPRPEKGASHQRNRGRNASIASEWVERCSDEASFPGTSLAPMESV